MESFVEQILLDASSSKALATNGPHGLNVVPVSAIRIIDEYIFLFDFFMHKTRENVVDNSQVALTAWNGLDGYQIKCDCSYETSSKNFELADEWCKEQFPSRTLLGVLVLAPTEVHDIGIRNKVK